MYVLQPQLIAIHLGCFFCYFLAFCLPSKVLVQPSVVSQEERSDAKQLQMVSREPRADGKPLLLCLVPTWKPALRGKCVCGLLTTGSLRRG